MIAGGYSNLRSPMGFWELTHHIRVADIAGTQHICTCRAAWAHAGAQAVATPMNNVLMGGCYIYTGGYLSIGCCIFTGTYPLAATYPVAATYPLAATHPQAATYP